MTPLCITATLLQPDCRELLENEKIWPVLFKKLLPYLEEILGHETYQEWTLAQIAQAVFAEYCLEDGGSDAYFPMEKRWLTLVKGTFLNRMMSACNLSQSLATKALGLTDIEAESVQKAYQETYCQAGKPISGCAMTCEYMLFRLYDIATAAQFPNKVKYKVIIGFGQALTLMLDRDRSVYLPSLRGLQSQLKRKQVQIDWYAGAKAVELSIKYGVAENTIYKWVKADIPD